MVSKMQSGQQNANAIPCYPLNGHACTFMLIFSMQYTVYQQAPGFLSISRSNVGAHILDPISLSLYIYTRFVKGVHIFTPRLDLTF